MTNLIESLLILLVIVVLGSFAALAEHQVALRRISVHKGMLIAYACGILTTSLVFLVAEMLS